MKMLRHLPDNLGEPTQKVITYQKGDDEYIVIESAGGRFIFLDEGGAGSSIVDRVRDVQQQTDVQDSQQGQEGGSGYSQGQGRQTPEGLLVSEVQTISSDQHTVIHHSVAPNPINWGTNADD